MCQNLREGEKPGCQEVINTGDGGVNVRGCDVNDLRLTQSLNPLIKSSAIGRTD